MTQLTRRSALLGTAAAALAPAVASMPAQAAAPPVGKQNAGFYRYKVGDIEVTVVTDGANRFKLRRTTFVAQQERATISTRRSRPRYYADKDLMTTPYNPIVVNTGSASSCVIDTGTGEAAFERSKGATGQFQTNLKAAGIDPQRGRHGDHLALPRRPHQRPAQRRQQARLPERRDSGAGGGAGSSSWTTAR